MKGSGRDQGALWHAATLGLDDAEPFAMTAEADHGLAERLDVEYEPSRADEHASPDIFPVAFGPPEAQLFGMYHAPEPSIRRCAGVVLCNPLGHEAMSTHGTYRHLAQRLARAGIPAFRFDYHGTGDSSGNPDDPARVRAWLDSIGLAIDQLRVLAGVKLVNLIGLRFGATLAAVVASERRDVQGLVLWAPCPSGRLYVRELRAFQMIKEPAGGKGEPGANGEIAGYTFASETLRDLATIDLFEQPHRIAERVLIIPRDDLPIGDSRLAKHFADSGTDAIVSERSAYASMMCDPEDSIVPVATLEAIVDWFRGQNGPSVALPGMQQAPSNTLTALSPTARRLVREQSFYFGEERDLFGILTQPISENWEQRRAAVVFLNAGGNHRVGPSRLYVSLARDLAALGYPAFRFDVAEIGDSRLHSDRKDLVRAPDLVSDVKSAISLLASTWGLERVILVGVCSGADLAFQAGLADGHVVGEVLINPPTLERKVGDRLEVSNQKNRFQSTRYYLSAPLKREVWAKALRGQVDVRSVVRVLLKRFAVLAQARLRDWFSRLRGVPLPRTDIERAFCALSDRGVESLLVFSSNDAGLDMIQKHLGRNARKMRGRKNVRLTIIENADHTFTPAGSQRELSTLITSFVEGAFP